MATRLVHATFEINVVGEETASILASMVVDHLALQPQEMMNGLEDYAKDWERDLAPSSAARVRGAKIRLTSTQVEK